MWTLITDTKKYSFRLWLWFGGFCFVLVLIQSWTGKLNGIMGLAWLWYFACLGPGLALLLIAVLQDRQSTLLISRTAHRVVIGFAFIYLLLALLTLLGEPLATYGRLSIQAYRQQSFLWLLPLEVALLLAYGLLFWSKRNRLFQKMSINDLALQKADHWGSLHEENKQKALQLIAKGHIEEALGLVSEHFRKTGLGDLSAITLLQAQWNRNKEKQQLGLLAEEEAQRYQNRQMVALLEIIQKN